MKTLTKAEKNFLASTLDLLVPVAEDSGHENAKEIVQSILEKLSVRSSLSEAADGTKVGHKVTQQYPSDRYPYEVVQVLSPKCVLVRSMGHKVVSGSMHDGSAEIEVFSDPEGATMEVSLRKDGKWRTKGRGMNAIPWGWNGARYYQAPEI